MRMDFVAIIMLYPELQASNSHLTPLFLSRMDFVERHASTPPRNYKDKVNNIQTFHVSKAHYVYYNYVANFPNSLSDIEDYTQNTN